MTAKGIIKGYILFPIINFLDLKKQAPNSPASRRELQAKVNVICAVHAPFLGPNKAIKQEGEGTVVIAA